MRNIVVAGVLGLLVWGASAVEANDRSRPDTYTICLDQRGGTRPVTCRNVIPGRLSNDQGFCTCAGADIPVEAPVCDFGERQPPQSRAFELARRDAARDRSLVGDSFEGQRMCLAARTDR